MKRRGGKEGRREGVKEGRREDRGKGRERKEVGERRHRREEDDSQPFMLTDPWNPLLQFLFQPDACLKIKVVGRFVQE